MLFRSNSNEYIDQLSRFMTEKEYRSITGENTNNYSFPIISDYSLIGRDLTKEGIIRHKAFGYSETRMAAMRTFCDFFEKKITEYPDCCVQTNE